ncbi:MAG TPA: hypothetical protein VFL15_04235 [Gammaproteobacteria bacterium]|nr:hypothetical protein [Gammaproteobacteria bacterium]
MDKDNFNTHHQLTLATLVPAILMCVVWFFAAPAVRAAAADGPAAPPASSSTAKPASTNLGKVQVTGIKQLVRTLQTVKVALNQPFSTSPDKADVVVCRIIHSHGELHVAARMGAILECGTNSWFTSRRDAYHQSGNTGDALADAPDTPVYERKGAWHSVRVLSLQQVQALRSLLNKLPPPDSPQKILVEMDDATKH